MKRLHVHVAVDDINQSIGFYSALFAAQPSVVKSDYAKWMLDDPRVNFAISARGREAGETDYRTAEALATSLISGSAPSTQPAAAEGGAG